MPKLLDRALPTPTQRVLFVLACGSLAPWAIVRTLGAFDRCRLGDDCVRWFTAGPAAAWGLGRWIGYGSAEWWDVPVLPGLLVLALAFCWGFSGRRVWEWIRAAR